MAFFAAAVLVDVVHPHGGVLQKVGEDGAKFLGIALWAAFAARSSW